jgi:hypothetical protein
LKDMPLIFKKSGVSYYEKSFLHIEEDLL